MPRLTGPVQELESITIQDQYYSPWPISYFTSIRALSHGKDLFLLCSIKRKAPSHLSWEGFGLGASFLEILRPVDAPLVVWIHPPVSGQMLAVLLRQGRDHR